MTDAKSKSDDQQFALHFVFHRRQFARNLQKPISRRFPSEGRRHVRNPAGRTDGRKHCFPDISQRKGSQGKNPLTIIHQPN